MMKIKKIPNIKQSNLIIYNNSLFYFDDKSKSIKNENNDVVFINEDLFYVLISDGLIHIFSNAFYDLNKKQIIRIEDITDNSNDYIECFILEGNLYVKKFTEKEEIFFYRINEKHKAIPLKHIGNPIVIKNQISVELIDEFVQCLNNQTGKELWQRRYSSLTGVEQNNVSSTILENNAKLYIAISSEGRSGLFVLDIATGEEVAFYERAIGFLVKDKQYIYTYKGDFCILKINAQTNKVEEIPLKEVLLSNGFNPNSDLRRSTVKDNNVYFTQFLGTPNSKLGIINLDTKEMLYKHDFAEENGLIGSIEVSNGRVFVHTQDNTLHIFEREE